MRLYDISAAIMTALEIDPETGEINPESEARLAALEGEKNAKACDIACIILDREAEAAAHRAEAKKQTERARIAEGQAEWLRDYLCRNFGAGEKGGDVRVSFRIGEAQSVEISEDANIPTEYMVPKFSPDKKAIKAALEAGLAVDGARVVTKRHVVIK